MGPTESKLSRLMVGRVVDVADRKSAIALLGPLEMLLRFCCSVERARCSVFRGFGG